MFWRMSYVPGRDDVSVIHAVVIRDVLALSLKGLNPYCKREAAVDATQQ